MAGSTATYNGANAHMNPIAGFVVSDKDETTAVKYYGYVDGNGGWYLMKWDSTADTFRFCFGTSGYTTAWTNRASQTYALFYA